MINYGRCLMLAEKYGVEPRVIENDYLVEMVLDAIARDETLKKEFVFRGGTCLHKVYFQDYRFSEDVDFIFNNQMGVDAAGKEMIRVLEKLQSNNPQISGWAVKRERDRFQTFVQYDIVPEIITTDKVLKLDLCEAREMPAYSGKPLNFLHEEFKKEIFTINVYEPEAVVADKISRTISINKEARDIYDLKHLFSADINTDKINAEFRKTHSYDVDPVDLINKINDTGLRNNWETRLKHQIEDLPSYDSYIRQLVVLIKKKYRNSFQE